MVCVCACMFVVCVGEVGREGEEQGGGRQAGWYAHMVTETYGMIAVLKQRHFQSRSLCVYSRGEWVFSVHNKPILVLATTATGLVLCPLSSLMAASIASAA